MRFLVPLLCTVFFLFSCSEKKKAEGSPTIPISKDSWNSYQIILNDFLKVKTFKGQYGSYTHNLFDYDSFKKSKTSAQLLKGQNDVLKDIIIPKDSSKALTFWINAYNYLTLVEVYRHYPTKSMKDIGWKNKVHSIGGSLYSLDEIEHKIIRPMKEPRIHFAINCASISCPSLKSKIYTVENLDKELSEQTQNALKNPLHLKIVNADLHVTELFDWFEEDFEIDPYGSVEGFIASYAPKELQKPVEDWIDYNWQLNKP